MKYVKNCLIIMIFMHIGYSECFGDVNLDTYVNVVDIILLSNCILAQDFEDSQDVCGDFSNAPYWCLDINSDGQYNILDLVTLAVCILAYNCDDIGGSQ